MGILDRVLDSKSEANPPPPNGYKNGDTVLFDNAKFKLASLVEGYSEIWSGQCIETANASYHKGVQYWLHEEDIKKELSDTVYYVYCYDEEYPRLVTLVYYLHNTQFLWYNLSRGWDNKKSSSNDSEMQKLIKKSKLLVVDPWPQWLVDWDANR